MIPDGWKKELFGNVASFKNGLNFTRSDTGDAIKIVGVGNFKAFSELSSTSHLDTIQVANKVKGIELLEDGDLLFVRSNGNKALIGRCLYFPNVTERLAFSGFTIRGRVNANEVLPKYASYLVRSSMVKAQFLKSGSGTNISNLSQQILNSVAFNLPPLPEQKKIAQILSTWDKAIETVEKLITNSQQKKKALMQQLLTGKKRFPEFDGEWKEVQLGDISRITTGSSNREDSSVCDGEFAFFDRSEDIRTSSRYLFDNEAVIIPGEGQKFVPKHFKGKFDLHQRTYAIMDFKNTLGKFLYYYIGYFQHYFLAQAVGSTVKSLRLPMFQKMPIKLPCIEEQQKIASILSSADQEIETWQQELEHLKQEKKALMQQLLTGKRRVTVDTAKTGDTHA